MKKILCYVSFILQQAMVPDHSQLSRVPSSPYKSQGYGTMQRPMKSWTLKFIVYFFDFQAWHGRIELKLQLSREMEHREGGRGREGKVRKGSDERGRGMTKGGTIVIGRAEEGRTDGGIKMQHTANNWPSRRCMIYGQKRSKIVKNGQNRSTTVNNSQQRSMR